MKTDPATGLFSGLRARLYGRTDRLRVFLSLFRGVTFVLAAVQLLVQPLFAHVAWPTYLVLLLVGLYSLGRMIVPDRWYQFDRLTKLVFGVDVLLCMALLMVSGGLGSPFLLYSLNPVLALALLGRRVGAVAGAVVLTGTIALLEAVPSFGLGSVYDGTILGSAGLVTVYGFLCLLGALLPFFMNVRVSRHLEQTISQHERRRLACEMHDSLAQDLGYLRMQGALVERALSSGDTEGLHEALQDLRHGIDHAYRETRAVIDMLRGDTVGKVGLIPALAGYIHDFGMRTGMRTEFRAADGQTEFSSAAELQLLRVVHEAIANIGKHAGANTVSVGLETHGQWTTISIEDDGRGFDIAAVPGPSAGEHLGLQVMRERAESLGGTFQVESMPGAGTRISIRVPHEGRY